MGVCIHPKYGGWFAMRGVLIFKNLTTLDSVVKEPIDVLNGDETLIHNLLTNFNTDWKNGKYRDIIQVDEKYSHRQMEYFNTDPNKRKDLIFSWFLNKNNI
jgi:methylmalonic aciduria homocystinuria type C protein